MSAVEIAIDLVGNDLTGGAFGSLFGSVGRLNGLLGGLNKQMGDLPFSFGQAAGAGIGAAGAFGLFEGAINQSVQAGGDLQTSMINMSLMVHGAADVMPELTTAVIDLADHSTYASGQVGDAFAALGKHMITAQEILDGVGQSAIRLGLAMGTDAAPAADLLGQAMQLFNDQGYSSAQIADMLDAAFHNGVPSVDGLRQAFASAGGMADTLGVKMDDFLTVLDQLAPRMGSASQAGTALRYAMQNMVHPIGPAKDEMKALGLITLDTAGKLTSSKFYDAQGNFIGLGASIDVINNAIKNLDPEKKAEALGSLFNVRSGQGVRALLQGLNDVGAGYDAIKPRIDAAGQAQRDADERMKGYQAVAKEFGATLTDAWARVGMAIIPSLTGILGWLNQLIDRFNKAGPEVHQLVAVFLIVGAVLSGVVVAAIAILIIVMSGLGPIIAAVAVGFFGVIALAGLIVAAFVGMRDAIQHNSTLMSIWNTVVKFLGDMLGVLKDQGMQLLNSLKLLLPVWDVLKVVLLVIVGIIVGILIVAIALVIGVFIALAVIIRVVIQVLAVIGSAIGAFFSGLGSFVQAVPGWFTSTWAAIVAGVTSTWNTITSSVGGFMSNIGSTIQSGLKFVEDLFNNSVKAVVGFFKWLYDHNYYFKDLVDFIRNQFTMLRSGITTIWNGITSFLSGIWNGIVSFVRGAVNSLTSSVNSGMSSAQSGITSKLNQIRAIFQSVWNVITGIVGGAISNLVSKISGGIGQASSAASGIVNAVKGVISALAGFMLSAGANAVQMLANGIRNAAGAVIAQARAIADKVKSLLGFHSPPPEGPLSDSDEYMPNMMKMFASGMDDHIPTLGKSLDRVGALISGQFTTPQTAAQVGYATPQQAGTVVVPVYMDGKQIAQYTLDLASKKLVQSGASRYAR